MQKPTYTMSKIFNFLLGAISFIGFVWLYEKVRPANVVNDNSIHVKKIKRSRLDKAIDRAKLSGNLKKVAKLNQKKNKRK